MSPGFASTRPRTDSELKVGRVEFDVDGAEIVELTFVDRKRQEEPFPLPVGVSRGRHNPHVRIAVFDVVPAEELAVEIEAVGIVDGCGLQEVEDARFGGGDHTAQFRIGEALIADEVDADDLGFRPLADFKHKIDAIVVELDNLRVHLGRVIALAAVHIEDALNVGLDAGAGVHRARLQLHFLGQSIAFDLCVPLERNAVDERILNNGDHHDGAFAIYSNVLEETGCEEGSQAFIGFVGVVALTGGKRQIGFDGFRLESLAADDPYIADDASLLGKHLC